MVLISTLSKTDAYTIASDKGHCISLRIRAEAAEIIRCAFRKGVAICTTCKNCFSRNFPWRKDSLILKIGERTNQPEKFEGAAVPVQKSVQTGKKLAGQVRNQAICVRLHKNWEKKERFP